MFPFEKIYAATVFKNTDPLLEGRVQIYIDLFMSGYSESLLPWARPFFSSTGGSSEYGESRIPEEDSKVWVWFENEEDKKNPFYVTGIQLQQLSPHLLYEENVRNNITDNGTTLATATYPDVKFTYEKNGVCVFVSSGIEKEWGVYHPSGTYLFISNDGKVYLRSGSGDTERMVLGETLRSKLDTLLTQLQTETHATLLGPTSPPLNASAYASIQGELDEILSSNIKNN